jgi:hypothetical protein
LPMPINSNLFLALTCTSLKVSGLILRSLIVMLVLLQYFRIMAFHWVTLFCLLLENSLKTYSKKTYMKYLRDNGFCILYLNTLCTYLYLNDLSTSWISQHCQIAKLFLSKRKWFTYFNTSPFKRKCSTAFSDHNHLSSPNREESSQ